MPSKDTEGQDSALEILKASVKSGKIFSGYIFAGGDPGIKLAAAKDFAKTINCRAGKNEPCDACASCRKINSRNHPDVFLVKPAGASSTIGIEHVRTVIRQANMRPYEAKKKIFIINEAHSMNRESSNAFLKTLEEPPLDAVFILISLSEELLLSTIVSRCQVIKFSSPAAGYPSGMDGAAFKRGKKENLKDALDALLAFFRDIFLYRETGKADAFFCRDRSDEVKRESHGYESEELDRLIKRIITLRSYVDRNVNPNIIVDVLNSELRKSGHRPGAFVNLAMARIDHGSK